MFLVGMVKPPRHQIVGVIAVRHSLVPAVGAVLVAGIVAGRRVRAISRVRIGDVEGVLVDVVLVRMVEMPVVDVVDVTLVEDARVTAARTVFMVVMGMCGVIAHTNTVHQNERQIKLMKLRHIRGRRANSMRSAAQKPDRRCLGVVTQTTRKMAVAIRIIVPPVG
jgi:hypothetical protein